MSPKDPRVACVDLPAFPLQLALRSHPEWREDPVVVVEDDRPQAEILWANRFARQKRIHSGMKFAQAQSLTRLHAAVVPESQIQHARDRILSSLVELSPHVEPARDRPGLFWIDPNGLNRLYESVGEWAACVHRSLTDLGFVSAVVVGASRYSVFALARSRTGPHVLSEREEREAARVPLSRLDLPARLREQMAVLGVTTLGRFLALPRRQLEIRYGQEAAALHELASGDTWTPLQPERQLAPVRAELPIDPPDSDHSRLLFGIKSALHGIVSELTLRCEGIMALRLTLRLDHASPHDERIETATPTLDVVKLIDLVRLRLSRVQLAAPVENARIDVETRRVHAQQIPLLQGQPRRDLAAAKDALARVAAVFGAGSVTQAELVEAVLPEARYRWENLTELRQPRPRTHLPFGKPPPLVRSVLEEPVALPERPRHETERWLGRFGAVNSMTGPGRVATRWWVRRVERDYYFVETRLGEILWIYYDRRARGWYLHGLVD